MTELRQRPSGRLLGELEEMLRSLPVLSEAEAADFTADIEDARRDGCRGKDCETG